MLRKFYLFTFSLLLLPLLGFGQTITGSIQNNGLTREYRLHLPPDFNTDTQRPLVFNLHGFTSNAFQQEFYSGMNAVADTADFLVCYAQGIDDAWNVGWAFGSMEDDVDFLSNLIDTFIAEYNIDPARVYSCGMSNGGFMSYRLACELNDRIAAIASVTGSMSPSAFPECDPGRPVPVMQIHGTADDVVQYEGTPMVSVNVDTVVNYWVQNNSCNLVADTTEYPNISVLDFSTAERIDYTDCEDNALVSFIKVTGGGHTWPGAFLDIGVTNQDLDASVEIWDFFNQFSLEGVVSTTETTFESKLNVFPNPASEVLNLGLDWDHSFEQYQIFNSKGQQVLAGQFTNRQNQLDISNLHSGVYYLSITGDRKSQRVSFVKM